MSQETTTSLRTYSMSSKVIQQLQGKRKTFSARANAPAGHARHARFVHLHGIPLACSGKRPRLHRKPARASNLSFHVSRFHRKPACAGNLSFHFLAESEDAESDPEELITNFVLLVFFLGLFPASTPAFGGLPFTLGFLGVCPAPLDVVIGVIGHPSFLFGIRLLRCIRCVRRTILGFAGVGVVFLGLGFSELGILWVVKLVTLACHAIQSPRSEVFMQLQHVLLRKAEAKVGQSQCHCRFGGLPRPAGKVNDRGGGHGLHAAGVEGLWQEVVEGGLDRVVPPFIAGVLVA